VDVRSAAWRGLPGASAQPVSRRLALIRQWAGHDAALAQNDAEIQWLERLVWDAIYAVQKAGQPHGYVGCGEVEAEGMGR